MGAGRYDVPVPGVAGYGKHLRPEHCRAVMDQDGDTHVLIVPNDRTRTTTTRWACQTCDATLSTVLVEPIGYTSAG